MLNRAYEAQNCSIASALEVVGERWTLLIVRDVFLGLRRFDQFQESLGIARNVLTDRLNWLVDEGILERVLYSDRPERYEYRLTQKGRDLLLPLLARQQWGDKTPIIAALVPKPTSSVRVEETEPVAGPGRNTEDYPTWRLLTPAPD